MKHAKKIIVSLSLCCLLLLTAIIFLMYRAGYFTSLYNTVADVSHSYTDNAQYTQRQTLFEISPVTKADIIFIGDSITARGEWQEFYPDKVVLNRGIDSDVVEGVFNRLDTIIAASPEQIFLMIGINDLRQNIPTKTTLSFYTKTLDRLKKELPDCDIYVQSILPVNSSTGIPNSSVQALNEAIAKLAAERDMTYIDLYSLLVDKSNDLPKEYSIDGVHMTGASYQIWIDELKKHS